MKKSILLIALAIVTFNCNLLNAQYHLQLLANPANVNYDNIVSQTETYYQTHYNGPGSGYKQFCRWKEDRQFKLDANRNLFNYEEMVYDNYNTWKSGFQPQSVNGNWQFMGPQTSSATLNNVMGVGRINCIAFDPANSNIIYIGAPAGGIWRSTDAGLTWTALTDGVANMGVTSIAIDPSSPVGNRTIYILTGDPFQNSTYSIGVFKSTNNGVNWAKTGLVINNSTTGLQGRKLMLKPGTPTTLFVGMAGGLYMSTNSGTSWTGIKTGFNITDIEFNPVNPNIIYISTFDGRVFRSSDGGTTWPQITSGLPTPSNGGGLQLAVTPANSNYVYALYGDAPTPGQFVGLFLSTDGGLNFTRKSNTPCIMSIYENGTGNYTQSQYAMTLAASPSNANEIYAGSFNAWKSMDAGVTWVRKSTQSYTLPRTNSNYLHCDFHDFVYNGTTAYCANDGGLFKSTDQGTTWVDISAGLNITQVSTLGIDPTAGNHILFGTQDNATFHVDNSTVKSLPLGGDGQNCFFDPYTTPKTIYFSAQQGPIFRSTDNGITGNNIRSSTLVGSGPWKTPFFIDPNNHFNIFNAWSALLKSPNNGNNWNTISGNIGGSTSFCDEIKIAPTNSNYLYASKSNVLYKSINGGVTWSSLTSPIGFQLRSFAISADNEKEVWMIGFLITGGFPKIYYSSNEGATWVDKTPTNMPNIRPTAIVHQKGSPNRIFIGMGVGVYYLEEFANGTMTFQPFDSGIPYCPITQLEIDYVANRLIAATFGRGVWSSDLPTCNFGGIINIPVSTTWTTPYNSTQDINIPTGVTLTIKSTVYMPTNSRIIVNRGAKLIIDGGTITRSCTGLWNGIEVRGDRNQRQLSTYQGTLSIINGGSVQYAINGVETIGIFGSTADLSYTGGIVQCTNALFRNNYRAVNISSYQNKNALGNPINNISYFTNCTFETTQALPANFMYGLPREFAALYDVNGINFNYCNFRNTALSTYTSQQRGKGIVSFDAGFNVAGTCLDNPPPCYPGCSCVNQVYCRFDGLTEGINASFSVSSLRKIYVNGNKFDNVQRGIICVGSAYSSASSNAFTNIPIAQSSAQGSETYGIYMNGATNFSIASNIFTGAGAQSSTTNNYGVIVSNSLNTASNVSFNTYGNLYSGTQTQNNNGTGTTGLKVNCNAYNTGFRYAWAINPQSPSGSIANQGDGCGSFVNQAGNTWNYSSTALENQIKSTINFLYYAGNGAGMVPIYVSTIVGNQSCGANSNSNSCSTGGGGFLSTFKGDSKYSGAKLSGMGIPDISASDTSAGTKLFEQNNTIRRMLAADSADAALAILEADNNPSAKRVVFGEYLARKNMIKANAMLNQLPMITVEDKDFSDYYKLVADITGSGKTLCQMNNTQETGFTKFAGSSSPVSYNAKAALMYAKNKKYNFIIERFTEKTGAALKQTQSASAVNADSNEAILDDNIPNPFNESSVINSYVPANASSAYITVCDYLGKLVGKYKLQNGYNSTEVSGSGLSGIYFYSLEIDGNKAASKKMVIVH